MSEAIKEKLEQFPFGQSQLHSCYSDLALIDTSVAAKYPR